MKEGVRALGIAESYRGERSVLGGAVVTPAGVVDGFAFETCTVGGLDATEAVISLYRHLDREDIRYLFLAGVAPAWYNLLEFEAINEAVGVPTIAVAFEDSDGLKGPLRDAFEGEALAERLAIYESLPPRRHLTLDGRDRYVRALGVEDVTAVVSAFTPRGARPEPLRVARLAARAVDAFRHEDSPTES